MNARQYELNKIDIYKMNWYALVACICVKTPKSVSQSCKYLGVELKHENAERLVYREPKILEKEGALI